MSVIHKLPPDSMFLPSVNLFTADFNSPTAGKYDWAVAANQNQEIMGISPGFLYFISILNFGATIQEGVFLENVETIPRIQFLLSKSAKGLFGGGYPIANYLKNNELAAFFWTTARADSLVGTFTGTLGQNASLAGIASVTSHVSLNCFQIVDKAFINEFFGLSGANRGAAGMLQLPKELERRL